MDVQLADRIKAATGVAALHALIGYGLIAALGIEIPAGVRRDLKLFTISPDPPPPVAEKPVPRRERAERREGEASPPNLEAEPAPIVAPPPQAPLIVPPPVIAAPIAGLGGDPSAGAADIPGPGTGAGGQGTGRGGGAGDGDGDGGYSAPRRLRGRLKNADYPRAAGEDGLGRTITLRFTVEANGRASGCTVLQSSGNAILDEATCRAIERRYRYEPSRDAEGTAVPSMVVEEHVWTRHGR